MNGIFTGLIVIGLGGFAVLIAYASSRATGSPFVSRNTIGGYNGVVGIGAMVLGIVILVVSFATVLLSR